MKTNKKGQALVELALTLPIFLLVIVGIFDFGRIFHCWSCLNNQCIQAVRDAVKRENSLNIGNGYTSLTHSSLEEVKKVFWSLRSPIMSESDYEGIAFDGVGSVSKSVTIKASYNITLITPFLSYFLSNNAANKRIKISASATEIKE